MNAPLSLGGALASLLLAACDPCACVNSCTRLYELRPIGEPAPLGATVELANHSESGMDCEIDDVPKSVAEGQHTLKLTVRSTWPSTSPTHSYSLDLEAIAAADAPPDFCDGVDETFGSVNDLTATELEEGRTVCLKADIRAMNRCTQKGCGY